MTPRTRSFGTEPVARLLWHACTQTTMSVGVYGIYALTNAWFIARGVGAVAFAAVNLVAPLLLLLGAVATTVGVGGASLVSRSLGLGDLDQAARAAGNAFIAFWATAIGVAVVGVVLLDPLLAMADPLTGLFTDDPAVHAQATDALRVLAVGYPFAGIAPLVSARLQAAGQPRYSYWLSAGTIPAVRAPLLLAFSRLGTTGLWISFPTAEFATALLAIIVLRRTAATPAGPSSHRS